MFKDVIVVQSAVSAFNNAALFSPAFFWWALLALPLMLLVWWCAPMILEKLKWTSDNFLSRAGLVLSIFTMLWLVLFGGNYNVLRDSASVLPFMIAVIVFLSALFIGSHVRDFKAVSVPKNLKFAIIVIMLLALGMSDMHVWWGPMLQISAGVFGWLFGRSARGAMRPAAGMVLIMLMVVVAMLMQPEFFRFGQLGNLTPIHLSFVLLMGVCGVAVIALNNVSACGCISNSVFTKVKWLMRVLVLLSMALFLLTESVPVFIGMCVTTFLSFVISIYHSSSVIEGLSGRMLAFMLMLFGAMTTMPVLSAVGVLWWYVLPRNSFFAGIKQLL